MDSLNLYEEGQDREYDRSSLEDMEVDWKEEEEHEYLEDWMGKLGIGPEEDADLVGEYETEMKYLDDILKEYKDVELGTEVSQQKFEVGMEQYYEMGSWYLSNWIMPRKINGLKLEVSEAGADNEVEFEPDEISEDGITSNKGSKLENVRLTLFNIVGTKNQTRKRPCDQRTGCWWRARGWSPGMRRSEPWKVGRRLRPEEATEDDFIELVQVNYTEPMECGTVCDEPELLRVCDAAKDMLSDKRVKRTDYRAQNMTIIGGASRPHIQEELVMEVDHIDKLEEKVVEVSMEYKQEADHVQQNGKVPRGKYTSFHNIRAFWKEVYGEHEQFGQENDHEGAGGHHGQVEKPGQAGVLGGHEEDVQDGQGHLEGEQEQGGYAGEHYQQGTGVVLGRTMAMVGDGFKQEFRKIVRAGRRKLVPDGTVQVLLSKFVIRGEEIVPNLGGGTFGEMKRKGGQSASLDAKKLKL